MEFPLALVTTLLTFVAMIASGVMIVAVVTGPGNGREPRSGADLRGVAWWLVVLGWGLGVVPLASFWAAVLLDIYVTKPLVAAVALCNLLGATLFVAGRRGPPLRAAVLAGIRQAVRDAASDPLPVVAASAVAALYLFFFDSRQPPDVSCIYHAARLATGHIQEAVDLLRSNPEDARLGNSALLATAAVLHGPLGFRFAYAACGFLVALGGFEIGYRAAGRSWGWFGLVFLALNSYVLTIRLPDENLFALAAGCTVLALLAARDLKTSEWVLAGVLFGLLFTIRHAMVLALGAPLFAALHQRNRVSAVTAFAGAFLATTAMEHLHHLMALGSIFRFESHSQFPPTSYEILGMSFRWQGLMNWPLHDHVVRTPFNPFPTFVLWPLAIARHLGLLGFVAIHAGLICLWFRDRRAAAFWSLWALPVVAALAVQEAWDQANKMGVILIVSQAGVPWIAACWSEARQRPLRSLVLLSVALLAGWLGGRVLAGWRAPADDRYLCLTGAGAERAGLLEQAERETLAVGFLPRLPLPSHVTGSFLVENARALVRDLAHPEQTGSPWPLGFFSHAISQPGEPVTLVFDLSKEPTARDFLAVGEGPADADLTTGGAAALFNLPPVPWSGPAPVVVARRSHAATAVLVDFAWPARAGCPPGLQDPLLVEGFLLDNRCDLTAWMVGEDPKVPCPLEAREPAVLARPEIRLRVPAGALSVALVVNWRGESYRVWHGVAGRDGIAWDVVNEPFWHN